jgi:hypothetical protein
MYGSDGEIVWKENIKSKRYTRMKKLLQQIGKSRIVAYFAAAVVVITGGAAVQQAQASVVLADITSGLSAYWKFDDGSGTTAKDSSSFGNTITLNAPAATWTTGQILGAITVGASTGSVAASSTPSLNPKRITVAMWIRPTSIGSFTTALIKTSTASWNDGYGLAQIGRAGYTNVLSFWINNYAGAGNAGVVIPLSTWSFVVGTYDGSNVKFYLNGVLASTSPAFTAAMVSSTNVVQVGTGASVSGSNTVGKIDETRVYSRALTGVQILALYNQTKITHVDVSSPTPLSSGLIGYWPLDGSSINWATGSTTDMSGNGNFGTLISGFSTSSSPTVGKIGQALKFNSSTLFKTQAGTQWNLNDLTTSAWVYIVAGQNTTYNRIISHDNFGESGTRYTYTLREAYAGATDKPQFATYDSIFAPVASSPTALTTGWHFLAGVRVTHSTIKLYVDGVLAASNVDSTTGTLGTIPTNIALGSLSNGSTTLNEVFRGTIDDARIYNRALSAQEIAQLYKLGTVNAAHSSITTLNSGLVGYWTMDGGSINWGANTITDLSGQGNTGTLVGMSTTSSTIPGKTGQALFFNGTSQSISLSGVSVTGPATWSFWIKLNSTSLVAGYRNILNFSTNGDGIYIPPSSTLLYFEGVTGTHTFSSITFTDTLWHLITCTRDSNNNINCYKDAVVDANVPTRSGTITVKNIGMDVNHPVVSNINLDDVRVYNRTLSYQEIQQLYLMGK